MCNYHAKSRKRMLPAPQKPSHASLQSLTLLIPQRYPLFWLLTPYISLYIFLKFIEVGSYNMLFLSVFLNVWNLCIAYNYSSFSLLYRFPLYEYIIIYIYSTLNGHLSFSFQSLATVPFLVCILRCTWRAFMLDIYLRVDLLCHKVYLCLALTKIKHMQISFQSIKTMRIKRS